MAQSMHKLIHYLTDNDYRFLVNSSHGAYKSMPDEEYLRRLYRIHMGKELNLEHPQTFNEKLQWLKLHDRNPEYTTMVDKYAVKKWVADRIGEQYVIPLLGVWDHFDDIDFDALPDQFVLKCTHDSGGLVIVKDKSTMDKRGAKKKLERCLKRNYYWVGREWPYKNVPPRIIAEKYMVDESGTELKDYKVFNFDGEPKIVEIDFDRFVAHKRNLYAADWKYIEAAIQYPTAPERQFSRPESLELMLDMAKELSKGIPHVRTDFYSIDGKIYFGELTYYHEAGFGRFTPESFDEEMGEWIKLPTGGYLLTEDNVVLYLRKAAEARDELPDYKFFTSDGVAKALFIATERQDPNEETKFDFYDMDFKHLPFTNGHPNAGVSPAKPETFDEMRRCAEILSKGIPQLRVDFYEVNGRAYFGELTFTHWSGLVPFEPPEWDRKFGEWIKLPAGGYLLKNEGFVLYLHEQGHADALTDYKFYCFDGCPRYCQVISDRMTQEKIDFFDMDWVHQEFNGLALPHHPYPFSETAIAKPRAFEQMRDAANVLSAGIPFLRVDFYEVNGEMYFGELTFYPASGFGEFAPRKWNEVLGNMLDCQISEERK